ncbi:uncharacterized protein LOC117171387 [Belonocnema kinseyi]|uniref:uncharacterized protein LOC117171387 n=1 Tax=Belonocnema kinseyi TaxID=2817044 RepID=UPI00143DC590|nr:uncharacterized protein LOC117171387 [Belonocnema kinseyi]XP_033214533.1 uncharacterized protein LOC117171387 [Belonocnema kinseyi]XP_033214534.1 uncharacterized protein LOC117171387 [Belonocnema kinseyi]
MTKIRKVKRRKRFQANVNRKRLRNKLEKVPAIGCKQIKDAWEKKKSIRGNLLDMGLAYDPNEALKIPNSKREALERVENEVMATVNFSEEDFEAEIRAPKGHVAENLEKDARAPRERMFKLPKTQVLFVTSMMDKYGDDYKAMARDKKNYYQMTWRQIRAKINTFKNIPEQYAEYLVEKGEIILDDPTPLEETKKRIALDNYQKHSISKKPKKVAKISVGWEEEAIDSTEKSTEITSPEEKKEDESYPEAKEKLKLFVEEIENESKINKSSKKKEGVETVNEASNGILQLKTKKRPNEKKAVENINLDPKKGKILEKGKPDDKKNSKGAKRLKNLASSDSESEEELEGDENPAGFVNLSDLSSEELSEDDILDDGELGSDSEESD